MFDENIILDASIFLIFNHTIMSYMIKIIIPYYNFIKSHI